MKTQYSKTKLSIIVILGCVMFIILGVLYEKNSYTESWIVCKFPDKYDYYKETIKYRVLREDGLYGFYREEIFLATTDTSLKEREEYFLDIKETLEEDRDFKYEVTNDNVSVNVNTYMNVIKYNTFFNEYIKDFNITNKSTIEEITKSMEDKGYTCTITNK